MQPWVEIHSTTDDEGKCSFTLHWTEPDGRPRGQCYRSDPIKTLARLRRNLGIDPPAEDLTPEGIQLVIPGAERIQPASVKQGELF